MFLRRLLVEKIRNRQCLIDSYNSIAEFAPPMLRVALKMLRIVTNDDQGAMLVKFEPNFFKRSLTINFRSIPIMEVRIRTPDSRILNLMLRIFCLAQKVSVCEISLKSLHAFSHNELPIDSDNGCPNSDNGSSNLKSDVKNLLSSPKSISVWNFIEIRLFVLSGEERDQPTDRQTHRQPTHVKVWKTLLYYSPGLRAGAKSDPQLLASPDTIFINLF